MDRIIEFKGICEETGEWRHGSLVLTTQGTEGKVHEASITWQGSSVKGGSATFFTYEVKPKTVCWHTGYKWGSPDKFRFGAWRYLELGFKGYSDLNHPFAVFQDATEGFILAEDCEHIGNLFDEKNKAYRLQNNHGE